ncbi:hypothetical protein [Amycolatopsis balhimycina]|uniref:hypothetical protein n=1 Tax=Amycolatopsis balhimycina TaxID=208443 RepID=UPI0003A0A3AD|nr:hypothetical protein [Amycolatopsis balhimycina]
MRGAKTDQFDAATAPAPAGVSWLEPVPDRLVVDDLSDPAEVVAARRRVRLALVAMVHCCRRASGPPGPRRGARPARGRDSRNPERVGGRGQEPAAAGPARGYGGGGQAGPVRTSWSK